MLDTRADSIIYQSQGYLVTLVDTLITNKRLGKALNKDWDRADLILSNLEAWEERAKIEEISDMNYVLECLISIAKLNQFPAAPTINIASPPAILIGIPGAQGIPGETGEQGETGLATDFQVSLITVPTVVDSFDIDDARGVRWDYIVIKSTNEQRAGNIIASWTADGSLIEFFDSSTEDIGGSTEALELLVDFSGGNIRLTANPASGTWSVIGTRYFIPNNGSGSGPISDVLANGSIYIGNASNVATAQVVSGDISITNTGVVSITAGAIVNADINASAAIALSKLAAVTADRLLISNGAGVIISSSVTATEAGYLSGVTSALQTQLNLKLTDPTTTIGDLIIRNGAGNIDRLGIGTVGQVLTVAGGVPTWSAAPGGVSGLTTDYIPKATSATSIGNSIMNQTGSSGLVIAGNLEIQTGFRTETVGPYLKFKVIELGDWDMDTTAQVTITHSLDHTKIRGVFVIVRTDSDAFYSDIQENGGAGGTTFDGTYQITSTQVFVRRTTSGDYDNFNYAGTGFTRGWITIMYEA